MKTILESLPKTQQKVIKLTEELNEATKDRDLEVYRRSEEGQSYTQLSYDYRMTAARIGQIVTKVAKQMSKPRKGGNHGTNRKNNHSQS